MRLDARDPREARSIRLAVEKLEATGPGLRFPHQSAVRGTGAGLRELRPRAGRSRWRVVYIQLGGWFVLLALAPEAMLDPRGFRGAIDRALARLDDHPTEEQDGP